MRKVGWLKHIKRRRVERVIKASKAEAIRKCDGDHSSG